jgi:hypothetical protein
LLDHQRTRPPASQQIMPEEPHLTASGPHPALFDLGLRLQHYIAARGLTVDRVAEAVGAVPDNFALALTGNHDLLFSTVSAVLDVLDLTWWQCFGSDIIHRPRVHHLTLESEIWHAIDAGLQSFDVRRDSELFCAGDFLCLHEKLNNKRTGRSLVVRVSYILHAGRSDGPQGYVVMEVHHHPGPIPTDDVSPSTDSRHPY